MSAPRPSPRPRVPQAGTPPPQPTGRRRRSVPTRAVSAVAQGARAGWAQSRTAAAQEKVDQTSRRSRTGPSGQAASARRVRRFEPPLDATSWTGAIILMTLFAAVLWAVQIANSTDDGHLTRFGIRPREVTGLRGVVLSPFLHDGYRHVLSNTLPVILIGWVVLLAGVRVWAIVTGFVVLVGGLLTWLVGPGDVVIVGASGLVFGWLGYLLARAYFSRSIKWIAVAVVVLTFFGTLLSSLVPDGGSRVSWQAHVCGFVAGVAVAAVLHPRGTQLRRLRRPAVS